MLITCRSKVLLGLWLAVVLGWAGAAQGQAVTKTFTGIIKEIGKATSIRGDIFYIIKLEEYPNPEFRISAKDAAHFGVIDAAGPTGVVTPKKSKGIGWKVKLTTENKYEGTLNAPSYRVISLERLNGKD